MTLYLAGSHGVQIACDISGHWDDPLVVLLHGGGQRRLSWNSARKSIAARGFLTLTMDARGHGDSDWPEDGDYSIEAQADDLRGVLAHWGRPAALVGASLGGITSLIAVGESPEVDATSVVLVDVTPRMRADGRKTITSFMGAHQDGFASLDDAADAVSQYLPHRARPKDTSGLLKNLRLRGARYYWHWDPRVIDSIFTSTGPAAAPERFERALAKISVPMLLIRGKSSELIGYEEVAAFRTIAPEAEFVDLPGAAHMVAGDRNDAFNETVLDFLKRHR